jgi:hypothetical protein
MVTAGCFGIALVALMIYLIFQEFLLPGIILLGSFILFTLWFTGLIETALQLYGAQGNVYSNCQIYVSDQPYSGNSINALAWLTQDTICQCPRPGPFLALTVSPRQLLESRFCVRGRQHHLLRLDDGHVVEGPSRRPVSL